MKKSVVLLFAGVVVCALILVFARKGADGGRGQIVPNTRAENDQPSDLAVTSIDGAPRTAVEKREAAIVARREDAPPPPRIGDPPKSSHLTVLVISKGDRRPLSRVRVVPYSKDPTSSNAVTHVDGARGDLDHGPITGDDGRVEFELPPATDLMLWASGESENAGRADVELRTAGPGESREIVVELPTGDDLHIVGRVVASEDGAPIDGARVSLIQSASSFSSDKGETWTKTKLSERTTGDDGLFDLELASWKAPHLRIEANGFGLALVMPSEGHESSASPLLVRLSRGAILQVHVVDRGGAPLAEAVVRLGARGYLLGRGAETLFTGNGISIPDEDWEQTTDSNGRCAFHDLPSGTPLNVEISVSGKVVRREGEPLHFAPGETREQEWRIGEGCRLSGRASNAEGVSVPGLELWLVRAKASGMRRFERYSEETVVAKTTTKDDGSYSIDDIQAGFWWLGPRLPKGLRPVPNPDDPVGFAPFPEDVEVQPGALEVTHDVRVYGGLYIRGRVLDSKGAPVTQSWITGWMEETRWFVEEQAGMDGTFAIGPLVPGRYALSVHAMTQDANSDPVTAQAGDQDVVLRLRPGGSLSGKVVDAASGQVAQAKVVIARHDSDAMGVWMTGSKDDGTFRLDGLEPASYDVVAKTSDGRVGRQVGVAVSAGADASGLVITLEPGARLRIRFDGRSGYGHFTVRSAGSVVAADGVEAGTTVTHVVPAGKLIFQVLVPSKPKPEDREIEIGVGEVKEIVFGGNE